MKSLLAPSWQQACGQLMPLLAGDATLIAVVPAAGRGERSGLPLPKQYHRLCGTTVLAHSVSTLARFQEIAAVVVVLDPDDRYWMTQGLDDELAAFPHVIAAPIGGTTRRQSVMAGIRLAIEAAGGRNDFWVMVHDAARPGLTEASIRRLWQAVGNGERSSKSKMDGAILSLPITDTVKEASPEALGQVVKSTLDRSRLWSAQTPQLFSAGALLAAYESCPAATDEASAIEAAKGRVQLVVGDACNKKLTTADDVLMMEAWMNAQQSKESSESGETGPALSFAVGQGFDVHAFCTGRPLVIGGIEIPFEKGLMGHSDADVLLHAIADAILGAAAMGDIGRHFPDTDPAFRDADSKVLLRQVAEKVGEKGWKVAQVDATVIAERPKIAPHAAQMASVIAQCVGAPASRINIKGKTTEQLGFTGRQEGIAAQAVAMLVRG